MQYPRSTVDGHCCADVAEQTPASFRPSVTIESELTRTLLEQIVTINIRRTNQAIGHLSVKEMWAVD